MQRQPAIITIDPMNPERAYAECRDVIRSGGVVAYPTDTFYGLGADPSNPEAIRTLYSVKGRSADQPILLLIASASDVSVWADEVTPVAAALMKKYWPGPLTLVFRARSCVRPELTAGTRTIGLRMADNMLVRGLLAALGHALTGTSANRSGRPSPRTAREAADALGSGVDLILDGGETRGGLPSTIVDVSTAVPWIIREGAVPADAILKKE